MSFQLADVVVPHTWLAAETGNNVAPAYYVVAGRDRVAPDDPDHPGDRRALALARCSGRNVPIQRRCSRGGDPRVATELQLGRDAADRPCNAAQVDITRRSNPQPHRPCRRRTDACAGRRGDDDRRRAGRQHFVDGRRRDALHMHQLGGGKDDAVAGCCAA